MWCVKNQHESIRDFVGIAMYEETSVCVNCRQITQKIWYEKQMEKRLIEIFHFQKKQNFTSLHKLGYVT